MRNKITKIIVNSTFFLILLVYVFQSGSNAKNNKEKHNCMLESLKCIKCKEVFEYEEEIKFEILNNREIDSYIFFGIKLKTENGWRVLTDDIRERSKKQKLPAWRIKPGEIKVIIWNKYVWYPPEEMKKHKVSLPSDSPIISYDIKKGGKLVLFAWKISPLPHGIHKNLQEFTLLPKKY